MLSFPKRLLGFSLLILVAVPVFLGTVFLIKQNMIQNQMRDRIELISLQTVTTNLSDIKWIKEGKEVVIDGKLFDVKSFNITGKRIILTGLFDKDEDTLITKMKNELQQKKDGNSPLGQLVAKYLTHQIFNEFASCSIQNEWKTISTNKFQFYSESMPEAHCFLTVPPPKFS